jgi:hypothetical protein
MDVGEDLLGEVADRRVAEIVTERGSLDRVDVEARDELDVRLLAHEALGEPAGDPGDLERVRHAVVKRRAGRRTGDLCDPPTRLPDREWRSHPMGGNAIATHSPERVQSVPAVRRFPRGVDRLPRRRNRQRSRSQLAHRGAFSLLPLRDSGATPLAAKARSVRRVSGAAESSGSPGYTTTARDPR